MLDKHFLSEHWRIFIFQSLINNTKSIISEQLRQFFSGSFSIASVLRAN